MKDYKDNATMELPGFGEPAFEAPEVRKEIPNPDKEKTSGRNNLICLRRWADRYQWTASLG
jgi:hypothetical protein